MKTRIVEPLKPSTSVTRGTVMDYSLRAAVPRIGLAYAHRLDPVRLERSLAQVISDYSVFSGRMILDGPGSLIDIERGCRGVPLEFTESPETSVGLVEKADQLGADLVAPRLSVTPAALAKGPLMAARLTNTVDGSVLGLAWNHASGDFHTIIMLLSAWARAYRGESYDPPIVVDDMLSFWSQHLTDDPQVHSELKVMGFGDIARLVVAWAQGTRRITIDLEEEDLATMHAALGAQSQLSPEDALWAHVSIAVQKQRRTRQPGKFAFAINLRPRLGVPDTVVGNITGTAKVDVDAHDDVTSLAAKIRAAIKAPVSSNISVGATVRFAAANSTVSQRSRYSAVWLDPYRGNLFISSLARFPYERLTFEPGAPMLRMYGSLTDVAMSCGLGIKQPHSGPSGRQIVLWLPTKLARSMAGAAGRARILEAGRAKRRPSPNVTNSQPRVQT